MLPEAVVNTRSSGFLRSTEAARSAARKRSSGTVRTQVRLGCAEDDLAADVGEDSARVDAAAGEVDVADPQGGCLAGPQPATIAEGRELAERELRRAAPPGRWHRRKRRGLSTPGRPRKPRPLACERGRARQPTPGGRPRYRQADGDPPSRSTRHRAMRKPRNGPSSVPGKFSAPIERTGQSEVALTVSVWNTNS